MVGGLLRKKKILKIAIILMQVSVLPREKKTGSAIAVAVTGNSNPNHKQEEEEGRKEGRKKEKRRLAQEGFKVKP
jgi:5'-3' exonuclease